MKKVLTEQRAIIGYETLVDQIVDLVAATELPIETLDKLNEDVNAAFGEVTAIGIDVLDDA